MVTNDYNRERVENNAWYNIKSSFFSLFLPYVKGCEASGGVNIVGIVRCEESTQIIFN